MKGAHYSIYRPRKDERLSWPSWLTYSRWLTHIGGHPSAAGRTWDGKFADQRPAFYHSATQPAVCFFCVFVCACFTDMDFSAEDRASGIKFCTAVSGSSASKPENHKFVCTLLPQKPKIRRIGKCADHACHAHPHLNITP